MTINFENFQPNMQGALNSISRYSFTPQEKIKELFGGMCCDAKLIGHIHKENYTLSYGNDGGFSETDFKNFRTTHQSSKKGLGNHGIGLRHVLNDLLKIAKMEYNTPYILPYFCIISKHAHTGFSVISLESKNDNEFSMSFSIDVNIDSTECYYDEHRKLYKEYLGNSEGVLFYLPQSTEITEDEKKSEITTLNLFHSLRIIDGDLEFQHNYYPELNIVRNDELKEKLCLTRDNHFSIELGKVGKNDCFKITEAPDFLKDKENLNIQCNDYTEKNGDLKGKKSDKSIEFDVYINHADEETFNDYKTYYGIGQNRAHDTGFFVSQNGIILNNKPFGYGNRGTTENWHRPIAIIKTKDFRELCNTEANKSRITQTNVKRNVLNVITYIKKVFRNHIDPSKIIPEEEHETEEHEEVTEEEVTEEEPVTEEEHETEEHEEEHETEEYEEVAVEEHETEEEIKQNKMKKSTRKAFCDNDVKVAKHKQGNMDNIVGISLDRITNRYEQDHKDGNNSNNDAGNLQLIVPLIHSIKTHNQDLYEEIKSNPIIFIVDQLLGLINTNDFMSQYQRCLGNNRKSVTLRKLLDHLETQIPDEYREKIFNYDKSIII